MPWLRTLVGGSTCSSRWGFVFVVLSFLMSVLSSVSVCRAGQEDGQVLNRKPEFSARLTWRTQGKTSKAQLFVKGDRYRIEHLGGVRTDLGYASVTIVRLDEQRVWYILSQRRLVLSVPMTVEYLLPLSVRLEGETSRILIGDSMVGDRPAQLFEVEVSRYDRTETYYEWVDDEQGILLKLASQDRDWSVEYEHIVYSKQPDYYFETPLGYQKLEAQETQSQSG